MEDFDIDKFKYLNALNKMENNSHTPKNKELELEKERIKKYEEKKRLEEEKKRLDMENKRNMVGFLDRRSCEDESLGEVRKGR